MSLYSVAIGAALIVVLLGVRAASANRVVRRKLAFSLVLMAGFEAIELLPPAVWGNAASQVPSISRLLFTLASINALVTVIVNPFRVDRVPERFPNILQDAIVIAAFLVVGAVYLEEKWVALSAVGGFVIGFALQDTLGNLFAGLAIQVEKPFRVGQWIAAAGHEGVVTEVTWRATRLRTKAGNAVILPNNVLSKEAITNYSDPGPLLSLFVDVGVSYDAAPNDVKSTLVNAVADLDLVLNTPPPAVVLLDFGASSIVYRVKFWIGDYGADDRARDQVRTAIYYALKRAGMEIPYPIQVEYRRDSVAVSADERLRVIQEVANGVDLLTPLSPEDRTALLASASDRLYGAGETIVRQGQPGASMFLVCRGQVRVVIEPGGQEVARIGTGGYFGEMSLLTGEPRTATVSAVCDCIVLEITADDFRRLALVHPAVVEQISLVVAERREGLQRTRDTLAAAGDAPDVRHTFLARVHAFLRLPVRRT